MIVDETATQTTDNQPLDLNALLKDVQANGPAILAAIAENKVVLTTTSGFQKIRDRMRQDVQEKLHAAEIADQLRQENTILLNTLIYVLLSFQGIAAKGPEIFELLAKLGIKADEHPSAKSIMAKLIVNPMAVVDGVKNIVSGFNPHFIGKIDPQALLPIFQKVNFDFSAYSNLIQEAQKHFTKQLPEHG